jgi:hypothetical protein
MQFDIYDRHSQRVEGKSLVPPPEPKSSPLAPDIDQYRRQWLKGAIDQNEIEHCLADVRDG